MKRFWLNLFLFAVLTAWVVPGWCAGAGGEENVYAVQDRVFHSNNEIGFSLGYIADDDFYQVYAVGLGYTWHLNEHFSWEVLRGAYLFTRDKDLKDTLESQFEATPTRYAEPRYMWHTHLVYRPLYGKSAFMNRWLVNNEMYFFAGPGHINYEWQYSTGRTAEDNALSLSFGAGMRFFLSENFCLNAEIRELINFRNDDAQYNPSFGLSLGYRFNLAPRRLPEDPTVKKLKNILDEE